MVRVYISEVVRLIHHAMIKALRSVRADDDIAREIWFVIMDPVLERYKAGLRQAILLVETERSQSQFTLNSSFNQEVQGRAREADKRDTDA